MKVPASPSHCLFCTTPSGVVPSRIESLKTLFPFRSTNLLDHFSRGTYALIHTFSGEAEMTTTINMRFQVNPQTPAASWALLALRITAGTAFMIHGWSKIQAPFSWMGPDAFAPGIFQALAALSEFGGGLAWILGLLTPLASLGAACTMVVAVWVHAVMRGDPFVAMGGGSSYELAALFLCISLVLMLVGPGRYSLDRKFFGERASA